jgi:hypothetical protein
MLRVASLILKQRHTMLRDHPTTTPVLLQHRVRLYLVLHRLTFRQVKGFMFRMPDDRQVLPRLLLRQLKIYHSS